MTLLLLTHSTGAGEDNVETTLGVYGTDALARAAVERARQHGFTGDIGHGEFARFDIVQFVLNEDWFGAH
jgi:hypothetical protein